MRAWLFRDRLKPRAVTVNAIQVSLDRRSFESREVDPIVLFINANQRLMYPERNSPRARERPLPFRDLVHKRPVRSISIEVHVTVAFGWPEKVLTIGIEVQIVVHVYPARICFGQYARCSSGLTIGEVKRQLGLHAGHCFEAQAATVGQPFCSDEVFEWFVFYVDPGCRS